MATIAEQLVQLNAVKQDIKTALIDKGVDMTSVPFTEYADKISEISSGLTLEYSGVCKAYENGAAVWGNSITTGEIINAQVVLLVPWIVGMNTNTPTVSVVLSGSTDGSNFTPIGTYTAKDTNSSKTDSGTTIEYIDVSELGYTYFKAAPTIDTSLYGAACAMCVFSGIGGSSDDSPAVSSWVTKTGYYNQMTAATAPAAYGITATDTIHFIEQWQIFDDDWTTTGTINCEPNQSWSVTQDLLEAKIIPTKITVKQYKSNTRSTTFAGTIAIEVSDDNSSWTTFGTCDYKENNQQSDSYFDIVNTSLTEPIRYVRFTMKADSNNTHGQFGADGFRIVEWKEYVAGSNNNDKTWVAKTGALAVLPESFATTQASGSTGGSAGSEIFKFDSPIRNFNGHMVIKGSGGDATYRQFGINVECYLDSTCNQSNMVKTGFNHTQTTSETTFNFSLGDDIEVYGIKYTIWSADASNNTSNVGTTTCTEAMITSWEELVKGGSYIPAGIDAIYNTSWEALAGAGHSPYASEVFDSGNNNKKGVYLCIRNASAATVYGSNDQSDWQTVISGNTGGSNDGATGTPKNLVSEEVDYRYFKATCTGYNNGHPTTVSWGVFEVSGSVEGGNTGTNTTKTQQLSQKTNTLYGGETQTLTFTFSELSQVLGITEISGGVEFAWLQSISINGNVVTAVVGNKRSSGGAGGKTTLKLTAIGTGSDTAQPTWVSKTGTLASSSVSGKFNPAWQTDDVVETQTIDLSSPTKVTSVYLYSGTRRVDNNGWCNGRVTLTGKTASGSTVTLLNKYTDFGRDGKTVELNNDSELVSVTWTWYTPDSTSRDYNVNQNGYISAWQVQE